MIDFLVKLFLIVLGFGVLIFVHELGHFLAAKWAGIRTEAFALGMGSPVASWRKGIGFTWGSTHRKVVQRTGKGARDLSLEALARLGIGQTEYSLRWLPIGGFVKMLGQDDADPSAVSHEPGSYNVCPIPKRMVVVSAGVAANIILAVVLFIIAFMVGVRFPSPLVGGVASTMPAGAVMPVNAAEAGVTEPGLQPGDRILAVDGDPVRTFVDVRIAGAMARPGQSLHLTVERPGVDRHLEFVLEPHKDADGLLGLGVAPGNSTELFDDEQAADALRRAGLLQAGVRPGMRLSRAAGRPVETYEQFEQTMEGSGGRSVSTEWGAGKAPGPVVTVHADVPASPVYEVMQYPDSADGGPADYELGLVGMSPLMRIERVEDFNRDRLEADDVVLRAGDVDGPRFEQLRTVLKERAGGEVDLLVLRGGRDVPVIARVDREGRLQVSIARAWDVPQIAQPMTQVAALDDEATARQDPDPDRRPQTQRTPVADLALMGRSTFDAVNDAPVTDWPGLREALRRNTLTALRDGTDAVVHVTFTFPTPGREQETLPLRLPADEVMRLHELGWQAAIDRSSFQQLYTTLSADGNPLRAAVMGFQETWNVIVLTYLTIDRLVRGSVGVEQVRGPVGIVHIGTQAADRGVTYMLFFLGIISVNLAVINFLPLPIVDGGLFLFLVYEKLKGRPPSLGFQNAATIVGVALIATAMLVVTWNDLVRLVG